MPCLKHRHINAEYIVISSARLSSGFQVLVRETRVGKVLGANRVSMQALLSCLLLEYNSGCLSVSMSGSGKRCIPGDIEGSGSTGKQQTTWDFSSARQLDLELIDHSDGQYQPHPGPKPRQE